MKIEQIISEAEIASRVRGLAREIAVGMPQDLVVIALLKGSFVFTADLIRALYAEKIHPQVDFMTLSSYGNEKTSKGSVTIIRDISENVSGREVLIVDDILESGRTLSFAKNLILERGATSCKIAVMLEKPNKRVTDIEADFIGFKIEDKFVVGYGLDYANRHRELPFIGVVS